MLGLRSRILPQLHGQNQGLEVPDLGSLPPVAEPCQDFRLLLGEFARIPRQDGWNSRREWSRRLRGSGGRLCLARCWLRMDGSREGPVMMPLVASSGLQMLLEYFWAAGDFHRGPPHCSGSHGDCQVSLTSLGLVRAGLEAILERVFPRRRRRARGMWAVRTRTKMLLLGQQR